MLASQIELILLITGLATAGALVLFLAPVTLRWARCRRHRNFRTSALGARAVSPSWQRLAKEIT
jgi:hypothetical protein